MILDDQYFMRIALSIAREALIYDEIPIGSIIVTENYKIIAKSSNNTERLVDITAHAEMLAITSASNYLNSKYLTNCTMYTTLEPCIMCAGALYWSQIKNVVIGARDKSRGFISNGVKLHPKTTIKTGILEEECSKIIKDFFHSKR